MTLRNERSWISHPPEKIISTDVSLQGWSASCQGKATLDPWSAGERKFHINALELKAAKLAVMSFTLTEKDTISFHIREDNMDNRRYQKPGVYWNQQRNLEIFFEKTDQDYCQIPTRVNECKGREGIQANQGFQQIETKINRPQEIVSVRGASDIDLPASRVSHNLPQYMPWKIDLFSRGRDAFQISGDHKFEFVFFPFCTHRKGSWVRISV